MSTLYPHLFSTFELGNLTLPNRVVMAPMSTNMGGLDGSVTPELVAFYRARATGGTGMIIVEFCSVHRASGRSEHRQLSLETSEQVDGHKRLVEAIDSAGAVPCLQLQHGGPGVKRELVQDGIAVGPCNIPSRKDPDRLTCRALDNDEIEHLIECFGRTAELGVQAGYRAFELHGAHGYLLTTFLTPYFNQRDDAWGGDEQRRLAFPTRVIRRVKAAIGDRPLIYRLSAEEFTEQGISIDDMARIAPQLAAAGLDAIHVSIGLGATSFDKIIEPMSMPEGWRLPYARRIREATGLPVIAVGQIRWPATAEKAIASGDTDLIALGRPLLADPAWANKARRDDPDHIRPCTSCNYCITMSDGEHGRIGCAENPLTGRELSTLPDAGNLRGKKAVVVGGGPGGMAAALMLNQAGFDTCLYEARDKLGGGLVASAAPPFKEKLLWYQDYLERSVREQGIDIRLGQAVTIEELRDRHPHVVFLAHGARPIPLDIAGIDNDRVVDAYEVLMGSQVLFPEPDSLPVMIYGGGETGCETAEYLAERGYQVVLVSRSPAKKLARSAETIYRMVLLDRLRANPRIRILDNTHIESINDDGIVTLTREGESEQMHILRLLIAQGRKPDSRLAEELMATGITHITIGDARRGGRIGDAVHNAHSAVMALCASGTAETRQLEC
jgi:2,4-dienoyl-CoA reductase-like NADH-dependent reductase (Old Yellow Enzyme family)/thioredoxin reductase